MKPKPPTLADPANLRRQAEDRLQAQARKQKPEADGPKPAADIQRTLHELQVHQIELEMQNTELHESRDRMEELLEKYADLYDFAPVGYFSLDEKGEILEVNLTGTAMLRVERSRLIRRRLQSFVAPQSRADFMAFLEKVFARPGKQSHEAALFMEGGGFFLADLQAVAAVSSNGSLKWCRVSVSDITALKQAEKILRQNEALFSILIEQSPVGVYVVDDQFRMLQVNPKARPVFSKVQPLQGRDFSEVIHILWPKKTADEVVEQFRHTLKTGKPHISSELTERRRDTGVTESYEWQIQRIMLPAGQHGVVCFFSNITERKRVEAAQRRVDVLTASNLKLEQEITRRQAVETALKQSEQHQRELLEQSRFLQEQLRQLSHQILHAQEEERKRISRELHDEIAQTLTGINVRLAGLKAGPLDNVRSLQHKITGTQRLVEKSVEIVHRFARELRPSVLDDLGLIPALHTYIKTFAERTRLPVRISIFAGIEQLDTEKRTVLYRVAQESLTNVARHARATQVEVSIKQLKDTVHMTIQDNGKSFAVDQKLKNKKFNRLGLLGMRERVEMVGGKLAIDSAPGKGTKIEVQIPFPKNLKQKNR